MKNVFLALLLFVGLTTMAQEQKERRVNGGKFTSEERVDFQVKKITKDLDLNDKQVKEVKTLVAKEVEKREARRAEVKEIKTQEREEMKAKLKEEQAVFAAEMKKVLTPEQFTKWEKSREEKKDKMVEKMEDRRGKREFKKIEEDK